MSTQNKCKFCGESSTLLCDGRIWDAPHASFRVPGSFINAKTRSCDAPVCRLCAKKIRDIHIQSQKPGGGRQCQWNTRDLCPDCQKVEDKPIKIEAGGERASTNPVAEQSTARHLKKEN